MISKTLGLGILFVVLTVWAVIYASSWALGAWERIEDGLD